MQLQKRCTRTATPTGETKRWKIADSPLSLVEVKSSLGLPTYWAVCLRIESTGNEVILSRHRAKNAATISLTAEHKRRGGK